MPIKINRNSWHYKARAFFMWISIFRGADDPRTLCGYFWEVVFSPLAPVFTVSWAGTLLTAALYITLSPLWVPLIWYLGVPLDKDSAWAWVPLAVGSLVDAAILLAFLAFLVDRMRYSFEIREGSAVDIAMRYVTARKQKMCPFIEYTK